MDGPIKFYHKGSDYYEFTNFAEGYPINFPSLPGYENLAGHWPTSEHAFQAAKFLGNKTIVDRFRQLSTSREAFDLASNLARGLNGEKKTKITSSWHGSGSGSWENDGSNAKKIEIMRLIVGEKFRQHKYLQDLLLKTGNKEIIEDTQSDIRSKKDDCWGNANNGKNWLGKILMKVREEFQEEEKKKNGGSGANEPKTPNGTGGTNINDNEEVKFLQHILSHFAKLNENQLEKKYHNFPNNIFNLHKDGKFSELEDYRIEMIKEILAKIDPKKVNELKKQILAKLEENNLISKTKEKELKKILEIEKENNKDKSPNSDEPAKDSNGPTNNDESNKPPVNNNPNNNKNDNSPNQKPVISSPVDTRKITNSATVAEACQQAKIQIIKLFQDNVIKPDDLDKSLWKGYESWEKYLATLTTSQEIAQFAEKLQKAISERKGANNNKKSNLQPTKSNWEKSRPWIIIGGALAVVSVFFLYLLKKRRKRLRSKI